MPLTAFYVVLGVLEGGSYWAAVVVPVAAVAFGGKE